MDSYLGPRLILFTLGNIISNIIFVFHPDTILQNKYNIQINIANVFILWYRELLNRRLDNIFLKKIPKDYDDFNQYHSIFYLKVVCNDICNIIHVTTKILSTKTKTGSLSNYMSINIQVSPLTISYIQINTEFVSHPLETYS